MPNRSILAAFLATSVLFLIGATPAIPSAAAANCQFYTTTTVYTGVWQWQAVAGGCTNVNAVEFRNANSTATVYMVDVTHSGTVHFSNGAGGVAYSPGYPSAGPGDYYSYYTNIPWGSGCGAPHFYVSKHFQARIHNTANGGSWGSWFNYASPNEEIC